VSSNGTHSTHRLPPNRPLRVSLRDRVFEFCKIFGRAICSAHLLQLELSAMLILDAFQVFMLLIFFSPPPPALVTSSLALSFIHVVDTNNQYSSLIFESLVMGQFVFVLSYAP